MSSSWYLMGNKYFSGQEQDEIESYAQDGLEELLRISPESYPVVIDGNSTQAIIQSLSDGTKRKVISRNGGIVYGSIISWNTEFWLVDDLPQSTQLGSKSTMRLCNESLRWKDLIGDIFDVKCSVEATSAASRMDIDDNKFDVNVPIGYMFVYAQYNDQTLSIAKDQRFIFGSSVYRVVGINDVSMIFDGNGVIQFTVKVDTIKDGDDFITKIADNSGLYIDRDPNTPTMSERWYKRV